jgi:hypothetical protein
MPAIQTPSDFSCEVVTDCTGLASVRVMLMGAPESAENFEGVLEGERVKIQLVRKGEGFETNLETGIDRVPVGGGDFLGTERSNSRSADRAADRLTAHAHAGDTSVSLTGPAIEGDGSRLATTAGDISTTKAHSPM